MRTILLVVLSFLAITLIAGNEPVDKTRQAKEWLKNQPLSFIENKGQFTNSEGKPADNVLFKASYGDCDIYITTAGISYVFHKYETNPVKSIDTNSFRRMPGEKAMQPKTVSYYRLDMNLQGSTINKEEIIKELPGKQGVTNYFYPHCPDGIYGVQEYGKITIKNIYKGIDWVIYTNAENKEAPLKYDFVVQPQANYKDIKIRFVNAQNTSLTDNGTKLKIQTIAGNIEEGNLYSYLQNSNEKQAIKTNYIANSDSTFEFELGAYDKTKALVIDPLVWATYYDGNSVWANGFISICTDSDDNIYITGYSPSINFPTQQLTGAFFQSTNSGGNDICILKFNTHGVRLWATYYGGKDSEIGNCIIADSKDNIYVTGITASSDFPTKELTGAYFQGYKAANLFDKAFVIKFTKNSFLQWATFYGGNNYDFAKSITLDSKDNIYITGSTFSTDFPTQLLPGAYNQKKILDSEDIFILKFNPQGVLQWATCYGGSYFDIVSTIRADSQGNIYITGETYSTDFPILQLSGAYNQASLGGTGGTSNVFIVKFDKIGILLWSTYYGGSQKETGISMCFDNQDNVYITGLTGSANFPLQQLKGAFNQTQAGGFDAYILKFNNQGERLWATCYGGNSYDQGNSICSDSQDNIYLIGFTYSSDLSTQQLNGEYWQSTIAGEEDYLIAKFNNNGIRKWATYWGGENDDFGIDLAVDSQNSIYCIGYLSRGAYTLDYGNGAYYDNNPIYGILGGIFKITACNNNKPTSVQSDQNDICSNNINNLTLSAKGGVGDILKWYSDKLCLSYVGQNTPLIIPSPTITSTYYARWESLCDTSECDSVKVVVFPSVSLNKYASICSGETYTVGISNYTTAGIYTDILKSISGCDSTVITNLVVNSTNRTPLTRSICQGESFIVGTKVHTTTGIYSDTLTSILFCDSIVTTNLTVNPAYQISPSPFICPGETVIVGTHTYSTSGIYIDKLSTTDGCDSIITTNLTVYPVEQNIQFPDKCTGESITVGVNTYTETGTYTDVLTSSHNCDSTVITHLTINPTVQNPITESICDGETFTVGTNNYSTSGNYIDVLKTSLGCDSTVTTILTVNPVPEVSLGDDQLLCQGDTITLSAGTGFTSYLWSDGSVLSDLKVTSTGKYFITVYNEWCPASDEITIRECGSELRFPNAFSPNNDYTNETFKPVILGTLTSYHIIIYNRWGQQIYESNDARTGWNGTSHGSDCAAGQYVYVATYSMGAEPSTQKQRVQRGAVTLLR